MFKDLQPKYFFMKNFKFGYFIILIIFFSGCSKEGPNGTSITSVVPLAPTELNTTVFSIAQIDLTWKDNSTNETGYKIERKTDSGVFTEIGSTGIDVTTFSDKTISVNTNYTYRVYSFNQVGKSIQYSNEVSVRSTSVPILTTTAFNIILNTNSPSHGAKSGGNISSDGGSAITTKGIVWGTTSNPTISLSTKTSDGTGTGLFQSSITGLSLNIKYYVRAYATNSAGTGYGNEILFNTFIGTTVAGDRGNGNATNQLSNPMGVYVDASGNIYVADFSNHRIQKWAPGTFIATTVAGGNGRGSAANQLSSPNDVFVNASGNVYVADNKNYRIQKWAPGATSGTTVAGGGIFLTMSEPLHVFLDALGNIFASFNLNQSIEKWVPGANIGTTVAGRNGSGSAANQFYDPSGLFVDATGNIYVSDSGNNRIQKWAPGATSGTTVAGGNGRGSAANQLYYARGVFVDVSGNIYVSDTQNHRIQKWAKQ
jgi:lysophospholipase L1-like esterase